MDPQDLLGFSPQQLNLLPPGAPDAFNTNVNQIQAQAQANAAARAQGLFNAQKYWADREDARKERMLNAQTASHLLGQPVGPYSGSSNMEYSQDPTTGELKATENRVGEGGLNFKGTPLENLGLGDRANVASANANQLLAKKSALTGDQLKAPVSDAAAAIGSAMSGNPFGAAALAGAGQEDAGKSLLGNRVAALPQIAGDLTKYTTPTTSADKAMAASLGMEERKLAGEKELALIHNKGLLDQAKVHELGGQGRFIDNMITQGAATGNMPSPESMENITGIRNTTRALSGVEAGLLPGSPVAPQTQQVPQAQSQAPGLLPMQGGQGGGAGAPTSPEDVLKAQLAERMKKQAMMPTNQDYDTVLGGALGLKTGTENPVFSPDSAAMALLNNEKVASNLPELVRRLKNHPGGGGAEAMQRELEMDIIRKSNAVTQGEPVPLEMDSASQHSTYGDPRKYANGLLTVTPQDQGNWFTARKSFGVETPHGGHWYDPGMGTKYDLTPSPITDSTERLRHRRMLDMKSKLLDALYSSQ